MSRSTVEIDFFRMEKQSAAAASKLPSPDRTPVAPLRGGIQSLVSRINPQLLKAVMASGGAPDNGIAFFSAPNGPAFLPSHPTSPTAGGEGNQPLLPPLPVVNTASRSASPIPSETAPLTIFYNGTVAAFDVPRDKAEAILRMAEAGLVANPAQRPEDACLDGGQLEGDLPIARKKSLQRFLEKRKERYRSPTELCSSSLDLPSLQQGHPTSRG
uniref:Protein TIFY n=1 Tax=Anthurium amnicola TaxID=1678845 RepID=A0A1D1YYH8_9ARAE